MNKKTITCLLLLSLSPLALGEKYLVISTSNLKTKQENEKVKIPLWLVTTGMKWMDHSDDQKKFTQLFDEMVKKGKKGSFLTVEQKQDDEKVEFAIVEE